MWASQPAHADDPESLVEVRINSLTPDLPSPDDDITLTGTVTNTSEEDLYSPQAYFWRSRDPITSTEGMTQAEQSDADQPIGSRVYDAATCGPIDGRDMCFQNLYEDEQSILAPGESAPFSVTVTADQLDLPSTDGVYLIGLQVRGTTDGSSNYSVVGRARVFAPMLAERPENQVQMTSVVLLSSTPSMTRDGIFVDDHLAKEIAAGGRLDRLLTAATRSRVTYAVDPALIDELEAMRDGYQVQQRGGDTDDGTGSEAADAWLDRFERMPTGQDGFRLPFAVPDLAAMTRDGQADIADRSERAATAVESVADLPLLGYTTGGQADAPTLQTLQSMKPRAVLLADTGTAGKGPLLQGGRDIPYITFSSEAFAGGPGPDPSGTAVHQRQRLLADTWIEASTNKPGSTLGRVRVITSPTQASSDAVAAEAPWMRQTTLSQLLNSTPANWDGQVSYPAAARDAELPAPVLATIQDLTTAYEGYADLLADPADTASQADAGLSRAASSAWRSSRSGSRFRSQQSAALRRVLRGDQVKLSTNPLLRLTSADVQLFPMTITNELEAPVQVKVRFTSSNSQRLTVRQVGTQQIDADDTVQVNGQARARANGPGQLTAQLVTVSKEVPIGRPVTIDVRANNVGVIGWVIVGGAGLVLIGTTALRIRKVRRDRAAAA